jgi:hypothetical protein
LTTLALIRARVEVALIDLPTAVSDAVDKLINVAHRDLQDRHNFWVMRATEDYTTVLETRSLGATPDDFKEFRDVPFWTYDEDGKAKEMTTVVSQRGPLGAINEDDTGYPLLLAQSEPSSTLGASNMHVYPLPDGLSDYDDGEYRITMPYWKYLPALTADGSTDWFTVNAEEYIYKRALAEGFALDWDEEREALWLQKAENEFKKIVKKDRMRKLVGMNTLVPHWQGANNPLIRW